MPAIAPPPSPSSPLSRAGPRFPTKKPETSRKQPTQVEPDGHGPADRRPEQKPDHGRECGRAAGGAGEQKGEAAKCRAQHDRYETGDV